MSQATIQFHGELNELLPAARRHRSFPYLLNGPVAVKHTIEALGIPHTEVEFILANDVSVDFTYPVQEGDNIDVYPALYEIKEVPLKRLRPPLTSPPGFVVDGHLGQLATYLRLLGFDTLYRHDYDDLELAQLAQQDGRVLLTRDRRLLMRKVVVYGCCLRTKEPREQLLAVLRRYRLFQEINPWRRCLRCNGQLRPVPKKVIIDRLEPKTKKYFHEFHICQVCRQIYWKGSHYEPLRQFVAGIYLET